MTTNLITTRLFNQGLLLSRFQTAAEVVGSLCAVQSQDYAGGKWAVGQRLPEATDSALDAAFDAGEILRTHVLRPTWHFVLPDDIRWMLELTGERVKMSMQTFNRQMGLDAASFKKTNALIVKALRDGNYLTRAELVERLAAVGIEPGDDNLRTGHTIVNAELDGLICNGPRRGKSQTYALMDERAPHARTLPRDEALAELARRYFTSHGPAALKDYVWWSGLTVADAKKGIDLCGSTLEREEINGVAHWFTGEAPVVKRAEPLVHLLPNYDEYIVGYADRGAIIDGDALHRLDPRGNILFSHTILIDGVIVGTWRRTFKKGAAVVETTYATPPAPDQASAIEAALARYGEFLGMPVVLS